MAPKLTSNNHFTVAGWMVTDLHLEGWELLVFALVYNFSQGSAGTYTGGTRYLCEWFGLTKPTVLKYLASLCEKGYLVREEQEVNGVQFVNYTPGKNSLPPVKDFNGGGKNSLPISNKDNISPYVCKSDKSLLHTAPQGAASQSDILKKFEELGCDAAVLRDWVAARKGAKVTQSVLDGMQREARKAGISLAEAVRICAENSWRGFRADYLHKGTHREERRTVMQGMKETAAQLWGTDIYGRPLR